MKTLIMIGAVALAGTTVVETEPVKIDPSKSQIVWTGKKVTGKHYGTIGIESGTLIMEDGILKGGEVLVDMTTINVQDLSGEAKNNLEGHLKSDDFFSVNAHKSASLVIKKVIGTSIEGNYMASGELTIKGMTHPVDFNIETKDGRMTTKFRVDRTKYDIRYGSGKFFENLGDKAISDEFELEVVIATMQ